MIQFIQPLLSAIVGLMLAIYGVVHTITRYPGASSFAQFWASLPGVMAVAVFFIGVVAVIAGVLLLVSGFRGVRRRWRQIQVAYGRRRPDARDMHDDDPDGWYGSPSYR